MGTGQLTSADALLLSGQDPWGVDDANAVQDGVGQLSAHKPAGKMECQGYVGFPRAQPNPLPFQEKPEGGRLGWPFPGRSADCTHILCRKPPTTGSKQGPNQHFPPTATGFKSSALGGAIQRQ